MSRDGLSEEVSSLLRCPSSQQPLRPATPSELSAFEGEFPEGAFLTEDGRTAYPIEDGFPVLVPTAAKQLN